MMKSLYTKMHEEYSEEGEMEFCQKYIDNYRKEQLLKKIDKINATDRSKREQKIFILWTIMNGGMITTNRYGARRIVSMYRSKFGLSYPEYNLINGIEIEAIDDNKVVHELIDLLDKMSEKYPSEVMDMWTEYVELARRLSCFEEDFDELLGMFTEP
jgi:hypothetical protein